MRKKSKTCAACGEQINAGAGTCPHCHSDANYLHFVKIPYDRLKSNSSFVRKVLVALAAVAAGGLAGMVGIALGGRWLGVGAGAVGFAVCAKVAGLYLEIVKVACPGCHFEARYKGRKGTFKPGRHADFDCPKCGRRTRIIVTPAGARRLLKNPFSA